MKKRKPTSFFDLKSAKNFLGPCASKETFTGFKMSRNALNCSTVNPGSDCINSLWHVILFPFRTSQSPLKFTVYSKISL